MGREIKRVPVTFDWPLRKVWYGYINPYYKYLGDCPDCGGSGYNPETRRLERDWYDNDGFGVRWTYDYGTAPDGSSAERPPWRVVGDCRRWYDKLTQDEVDALFEAGRLTDFTWPLWYRREGDQWFVINRRERTKIGDWKPCDPPDIPTAKQVNEWSVRGFGHDAINMTICLEVRATRLGVYGYCPTCEGDGEEWAQPQYEAAHNEWQETEPPSGEGWQLWENVSEGSPISPVFEVPEGLINWLVAEGYSWEAAENFVHGPGWAPSAIVAGGAMYKDIESCALKSTG